MRGMTNKEENRNAFVSFSYACISKTWERTLFPLSVTNICSGAEVNSCGFLPYCQNSVCLRSTPKFCPSSKVWATLLTWLTIQKWWYTLLMGVPRCHVQLEKESPDFKYLKYFGNTKHGNANFFSCSVLHRSTPNTEWLIDFGAQGLNQLHGVQQAKMKA